MIGALFIHIAIITVLLWVYKTHTAYADDEHSVWHALESAENGNMLEG